MSKVVNMGVIIRNEQGDTFPVALNPQMVGVIQNLLMQIPVMESKILAPDGGKLASKQSIPIIPRIIDFDWDAAYSPMEREDEMELLKGLNEKYKALEQKAAEQEAEDPDDKVTQLNPEGKGAFTDPQNPFNMKLDATGRANVDEPEQEKTNAELIEQAEYPDPIGKQEGEQGRQDVTVTPIALPLSGKLEAPGEQV